MANSITAGNSSNGGTAITTDTSGTLNIVTGSGSGATAIAVDTSQNVGVGTTTVGAKLHVSQVNTSVGSLFNGTTRAIRFGFDATGSIIEGVDNTGVTSFQPLSVGGADVRFTTSGTERMRLDSSGNVLVGTTGVVGLVTTSQSATASPSVAARVTSTSFTNDVVQIYCARDTNNASYNYITASRPAGTSFVVRDSGNVLNANNSYGSLSDQRIKENIIDATPKLEKINQVRVVNFNMIGDEQKQIGVVAQELEQIFPNMVEEDQEGTKSVKYSVFVPMLIKAIQELKAELDAVKAKVGV